MRISDRKQLGRLVEVVKERLKKSSMREIAEVVGYSHGYVCGISNGSIKRVSEGTVLSFCRGLKLDPDYILYGKEPKDAGRDGSSGKSIKAYKT
jgi:transcriptional regulator with XRE-family HTH domain